MLTIFILCFVLLEFIMRLHLWFMIIHELTTDQKGQILWQYTMIFFVQEIWYSLVHHIIDSLATDLRMIYRFREQSEKRTA